MAGPERQLILKSLRRRRWHHLAAMRDVVLLTALAAVCGFELGPSAYAALQASDDFGASGTDALKLLLCCAVLLALGLTARRAWVRMTMLRREARQLRRDLRTALVEETDHRTTKALVLGSEADGWLAAFLENEDRNTLFVEAVPHGHPAEALVDRFPPAAVRFETGLHSGFALMETREGPFDGPVDALALNGRPLDLPPHGTLIEEPLETVGRRILLGAGR